MAQIKLFDSNCMLGNRISPADAQYPRAEDLLAEMRTRGIDKALVYHSYARENWIDRGNRLLTEETEKHPELFPCWTVMPHYSGECPKPSDLIRAMAVQNVRAVRIFPVHHRLKLYPWHWGELLEVLAACRIPLLIDFSNLNWSQEIDWEGVRNLCAGFPELPVLLLRQGQAADRILYFLLEKHHNLYIETSYYQVNNGLQALVGNFGADRLIFGTGAPVYDPGCPIFCLLNSGLGEREVRKIACTNLESLLEGVRFHA